jgi:hypothetical protein
MILSNRTLKILRHFSTINPSQMEFHAGRVQQIVNGNRSQLARATLEETIPFDFGISDLPRFLKALNGVGHGQLLFTPSCLLIGEFSSRVKYHIYRLSDDINMSEVKKSDSYPVEPITRVGRVDIQAASEPDFDFQFEFDLSAQAVERILQAKSVMRLKWVGFEGEGRFVSMILKHGPQDFIQPWEDKNNDRDAYQEIVALGEVKFSFWIREGAFKVLPDNYRVRLTKQGGMVRLASEDLTYYMTCESPVLG